MSEKDWLGAIAMNGPEETAELLRTQHLKIEALEHQLDEDVQLSVSRYKRIQELEAAATYLSAEVKDAWDQGRISVDTFHAALAMDTALASAGSRQ